MQINGSRDGQIVYQQRLSKHHLPTAEHAAPAGVGRQVLGDGRHVAAICEPQAGLHVASELQHCSVSTLRCLFPTVIRCPDTEIVADAEHPYGARQAVLSDAGILLAGHPDQGGRSLSPSQGLGLRRSVWRRVLTPFLVVLGTGGMLAHEIMRRAGHLRQHLDTAG